MLRRRLFTSLWAGLSLLLFIGIAVMWVRSYNRGEYASACVEGTTWQLGTDSGRLVLDIIGVNPGWGDAEDREIVRQHARAAGTRVSFQSRERRIWFPGTAGFGYSDNVGLGTRWQTFTIPLWLVAAVWGTITALCIVPILRAAARGRGGRCPRCGYDLRATTERCPECGKVVTAEAKA